MHAKKAKIPAATSSSTIPVPSGSFSSCRTGGGLTISKALKSIKPARKVFHARGTAIRAISCPATSSMTTNWGSFMAEARATRVAAGMPIRVTRTARAMATGVRSAGAVQMRDAAQSSDRGGRCPGAGAGAQAADAEEGRDQRRPERARGRDVPATAGGTPALSVRRARIGFTIRPLDLRDCARGSLPRRR